MDILEMIRQLHAERARLSYTIATLERMQEGVVPRRGRHTMSAEERKQVSERMKRYWARRRKDAAKASAAG